MFCPPNPAFCQAVRQVLDIDDLIPGPNVVIPALRNAVLGPTIEKAHRDIVDSPAGRAADEAAQRMREKLEASGIEDSELEQQVASEWQAWFDEECRCETRAV